MLKWIFQAYLKKQQILSAKEFAALEFKQWR
jgi:hypothetical protein